MCIKTKFRTEGDAEKALNNIRKVRRKYKREKRPIRYYLCEICHQFHLTSKEAIQEEIPLLFKERFIKLIKESPP